MRLEKDVFEFEVQDITLSARNPVYTFTERGVTKNGKVYSSNKITCSVINSYKAGIYKKMHSNYDPINKDDDNFGRFKEDWDKWEELRKSLRKHHVTAEFTRFPKEFFDFYSIPMIYENQSEKDSKVTVADHLMYIASQINEIDPTTVNKIYIGGDWTSGNWVNTTMLSYYLKNITNTNDDLVLFMNLREKIHNEEKLSKFMIHIDTKKNVKLSKFANLFATYANIAEFYFYKPTQGNFILIGRDRQSTEEHKKNRIITDTKKIIKPITRNPDDTK